MSKYNPQAIEKKWQKYWAEKGTYKDYSKPQKFYALDMFPYPSGAGLHVGHPKGYIATDIFSRFKMLQGYSVLHPMGWDSFGLPAENYALKNKVHPKVAVEKNIQVFKKQLEMFGFTYDWDREIATSDPAFYRWTQWIFIKLFEKGLAYEADAPVNWCPSCKTVLANEDLEGGKCERCGTVVEQKKMRQWVLRMTAYAERLLEDLDREELEWEEQIIEQQKNWIGKSEGAEFSMKIAGSDEMIDVYTTRIDTVFGMTYAVLAPEHPLIKKLESRIENYAEVEEYVEQANKKTDLERTELQKEKTGVELKGITVINPFNKREIPLFVADYVLGHYGTGAVMAVPAHDERDFEFAKQYGLPIIQSIAPHKMDEKNPPREGKENTVRKVVHVILEDGKGKAATLNLKGDEWGDNKPKTLIVGGVEGDESPADAALREVREETGYLDVEIVKVFPIEFHAEFYAAHKDLNRYVKTIGVICRLKSEEQEAVREEERAMHDLVWVEREALPTSITIPDDIFFTQAYLENKDSFTEDGVLINSESYDGLSSAEAREKMTLWLEQQGIGMKKVNFKMRDWVFSRQRYWGEPIPIVHCERCGAVAVPENELPLELPEVESYQPTGTGEGPLAMIESWVNTKCPKCGGPGKRETNTMPQWAGSSWYYLRYIDPKNEEALIDKNEEKEWMPVDLYVGGIEHATRHLLYARFWHKFLFDIGAVSTNEPFRRLIHVGLILAEDGRKMSKRWNNVINPDDVIREFGADAMRLYEMFMGPFTQSCAWSTAGVSGVRRFLEKVWRLKERVSLPKDEKDICGAGIFLEVAEDRVLLHKRDNQARMAPGKIAFWGGGKNENELAVDCAVREIKEELGIDVDRDSLEFITDMTSSEYADGKYDRFFILRSGKMPGRGTAGWEVSEGEGAVAMTLDEAINSSEISERTKTIIEEMKGRKRVRSLLHKTIKKVGEDIESFRFNTAISALMILVNEMDKADKVSLVDFEMLTVILAPFAPHLSEELWARMGHKGSIFQESWPQYDEKMIQDEEINLVVQVNGKTRGTIAVAADIDEAGARAAAEANEKLKTYLAGKEIKKVIFVKGRLISFVT